MGTAKNGCIVRTYWEYHVLFSFECSFCFQTWLAVGNPPSPRMSKRHIDAEIRCEMDTSHSPSHPHHLNHPADTAHHHLGHHHLGLLREPSVQKDFCDEEKFGANGMLPDLLNVVCVSQAPFGTFGSASNSFSNELGRGSKPI